MNVSKSTMDKWFRQLKQGTTSKASPLTAEQVGIRELKKRMSNLEEHNDILKKLQLS